MPLPEICFHQMYIFIAYICRPIHVCDRTPDYFQEYENSVIFACVRKAVLGCWFILICSGDYFLQKLALFVAYFFILKKYEEYCLFTLLSV
jgi:hypothetical protein